MEVYQATFESLRDKLWTGWGSPRTIESVLLAPAGTHGDYIFVLYSFGLIGLILYLAFFILIWVNLIRNLSKTNRPGEQEIYYFYLTLAIILLSFNLIGIVHGNNFDLTAALLFWFFVGMDCIKVHSLENTSDSVGNRILNT